MKKGITIISVILVSILLLSFVSAGFWDNFQRTITGKALSQLTNVSVTVAGATQCKVDLVAPISNVDPTQLSNTTVTFEVHVFDQDGMNDINQTATFANFSRTGQTSRLSPQCTYIGTLPPRGANFTCKIDMWYWDGAGAWNISVVGNDLGNKTNCYNMTTAFTYNLLKGMLISPLSLTWPALSVGALNQSSNNDPTVINNTGNFIGNVSVTGIHIYGGIVTTEYISVGNFTSSDNDTTVCSLGTRLVNGTVTNITGTNSNPGNLSLGGAAGQESIYYCIPAVPSVSSQTYSTALGGSWTVSY